MLSDAVPLLLLLVSTLLSSGVRAIKLAVRRAMLLPLDVKLLINSTGSTRALRMAMIMSDGCDDEDDDDDGGGSFELSLVLERERALKADVVVLVDFDDDERTAELEVECEATAVGVDVVDGGKEVSIPTVLGSGWSSFSGVVEVAPNAKKGRKDPGRDA